MWSRLRGSGHSESPYSYINAGDICLVPRTESPGDQYHYAAQALSVHVPEKAGDRQFGQTARPRGR